MKYVYVISWWGSRWTTVFPHSNEWKTENSNTGILFVMINALLFWELLVFVFVFDISETLICLTSAFQVKTVLLDALQLLMLFAGTLTYSEPNVFLNLIL
jgi:hypothetical protein